MILLELWIELWIGMYTFIFSIVLCVMYYLIYCSLRITFLEEKIVIHISINWYTREARGGVHCIFCEKNTWMMWENFLTCLIS